MEQAHTVQEILKSFLLKQQAIDNTIMVYPWQVKDQNCNNLPIQAINHSL